MTDAGLRIRDLVVRKLKAEIAREPCESRRICLERELLAIEQLDQQEKEAQE